MANNRDSSKDQERHPYVQQPSQRARNPNPKANENIRVRTDDPKKQNSEPAQGVGSEITDGEDA